MYTYNICIYMHGHMYNYYIYKIEYKNLNSLVLQSQQ